MPDVDLFNLFRYILFVIAGVYTTVVTIQGLRQLIASLTGNDRYLAMLRRYLVVHGLRLRFRAFWGDVIICGLLSVAFLMLWRAHRLIYDLGDTLESVEHAQNVGQPPR